MALEVSAFERAGQPAQARAIESLLEEEVFRHVEPEIGALYRMFHGCYMALKADFDRDAARAWAAESFAPLNAELGKRGASFAVEFLYGEVIR